MIGLMTNFLGTAKQRDSATDSDDRRPSTDTLEDPGRPRLTDEELMARIVDCFRHGEVTEDQIKVLRRHLNFDRSDGLEVKLEHLRSKVDDLEAYADALEAFIDDEGTAEQVLQELRVDIGETDEKLGELAGRFDGLEADHRSMEDSLAATRDDLSALDDYVHDLDGRHSREIVGVDAKIDRAEAALSEEVETVRSEIGTLDERVDGVESMAGRIDRLEGNIQELQQLESDVATVRSELARIKPVQEQADRLEETIETIVGSRNDSGQLHRLQERVASVEGLQSEVEEMQRDLTKMERFRENFIEAVNPSVASGSLSGD